MGTGAGPREQPGGRRCLTCTGWTPSPCCAASAARACSSRVADVRGHAPRAAGTKMVVATEQTWGSIGGGNLEETAIARARALLEAGGREPETLTVSLNDKAHTDHGRQCCGGEVTVLLEPLAVVPSVAIFGLGHVGLELARILSRHDVELHLADSRAAYVDPRALAVLDGARHRPRPPRPAPRGGARRGAARDARARDDPRPRGGLRAVRRGAALRPPGEHRADRVGGQVAALREGACASRATPTRRSPGSAARSAPARRARSPPPSRSASPPSCCTPSTTPPCRTVDDARPGAGPRHSRRPADRRGAAQRRGRLPPARRRRDRRARGPRHAAGRPPRRRGARPARRRAAARPGGHPRALPAGAGDRRAGDAAAGVARAVRAARGGAAGGAVVRRGGGRGVRRRPGVGGDHHGAGVRLALRLRRGRPLHPGRPGRPAGSPAGWSSATATCPPPC